MSNWFPPPPPPKTPYPYHRTSKSASNSLSTTQLLGHQSPMLNAGRTIVPRVGGVEGNIAWTGGSNISPSDGPRDVRCFRPTDFRSMQEQDKVLKQGIADNLKLTLIDENENKDNTQTVSGWIDEVKFLIETNGMDTVFRIFDWKSKEIYMLDNWGSIKLDDV